MAPIKFIRYDYGLKSQNPQEWEFRRANERSHAARIGHERRRRKEERATRQGSAVVVDIKMMPQPWMCVLDPFLRLSTEYISTADKELLHIYLQHLPSQNRDISSPYAKMGTIRDVSMRHICTNEIILQWVLLLAETRSSAARPPDSPKSQKHSSLNADSRRQQIYTTMRRVSSSADICDDQLLYGVAFAAMAECRIGSMELAQVHLGGCLAIRAARDGVARRNGKHGPSLAEGMLAMYDIAACELPLELSGEAMDDEAAGRYLDGRLRAMESWWVRKRADRFLRLNVWALGKMARLNGEKDGWSPVLDGPVDGPCLSTNKGPLFPTLCDCLNHCLADTSECGSRKGLIVLFVLNLFLWSRNYSTSDVLDFLRKLDQRLAVSLSSGLRPPQTQQVDSILINSSSPSAPAITATVSEAIPSISALLFATTALIYETVTGHDAADYENVFVWEVARSVDLSMRLGAVGSVEMRGLLGSWILGILEGETGPGECLEAGAAWLDCVDRDWFRRHTVVCNESLST